MHAVYIYMTSQSILNVPHPQLGDSGAALRCVRFMPRPVDSAACSAWPICSLGHFVCRSSVHALLHKAAAWELRCRPCVSECLLSSSPRNPNFTEMG